MDPRNISRSPGPILVGGLLALALVSGSALPALARSCHVDTDCQGAGAPDVLFCPRQARSRAGSRPTMPAWTGSSRRRQRPPRSARDRTRSFRRGLLRHVAIEEKILLPAAQRARGGDPLALAARLRLDHGAIAALLVPTPTPAIVATLRHILTAHNALEEEPGGLYAVCDDLLAGDADAIVGKMASYPDVPMSPHNDGPGVMAALRRALERAGYRLRDDAG
jgi:hypothetical protein